MIPIMRWGSDELKARYLPEVASGRSQASYCLSEPDAGSDVAAMRTRAVRDGDTYVITGTKYWVTNAGVSDLYPDAVACLEAVRAAGYRTGLAGNQSARLEAWARSAGLPVDVIGSSASWGVRKPSPAFFARLVAEAGFEPAEVAYVGDRVDNDVEPAAAAG